MTFQPVKDHGSAHPFLFVLLSALTYASQPSIQPSTLEGVDGRVGLKK